MRDPPLHNRQSGSFRSTTSTGLTLNHGTVQVRSRRNVAGEAERGEAVRGGRCGGAVSGVHRCLCCGGDPDERLSPPRGRRRCSFPGSSGRRLGANGLETRASTEWLCHRATGVKHGKVETVEYDSKSVGDTRKMTVYLPPGYSKDTKYPVLYLLHGAGDNNGLSARNGAANVILDNLFADKKIVPMIVVMPNGSTPGAEAGHGPRGDDHEAGRCRQEWHRFAGRIPRRRRGPLQGTRLRQEGTRLRQAGRETTRRRPR